METKNKKELGQFYTKNAEYILKNMIIDMPQDTCRNVFVDPFAGEKDLIKWISKSCRRKGMPVEAYDIDPKSDNVDQRDSLLNPPDISGKYIITNPPYRAKNKSKEKNVFEFYKTDDMYKASIKMIMGWDIEGQCYDDTKACKGGIVIVPVNFFSDRGYQLREDFMTRYKIISLNIFEETVFKDTTYTVCAFNFCRRINGELQRFRIRIYPDYLTNKEAKSRGYHMRPTLSKSNRFTIGYAFHNKIQNKSTKIKAGRLVRGKKLKDGWKTSRLYLRAIDTGSNDGRIKLSLRDNRFFGKISERTHATIIFSRKMLKEEEEIILGKFNEILEEYRNKYHSLFLTNFRNSTVNYARKRIDFKMAFDLISHIIKTELEK